ncbi:CGNR zinc finger domain-containing protein [Arthrobacter sp. B2a2-09]|uniref:CGNR zinc finger domain-containing protein n=1 Tax=Arthrobacter sp. B2a2-09 TaxID=2952822 RepID=UPI003FA45702
MVIVHEGRFASIRTCDAGTCNRLFFDSTKNQSRRYCTGRGCAARTHSANFRQREEEKKP